MASAPGPSMEDQGALNVKNLSSELKLVADWHQLGIKLGLPPAQLRQIEKEHPGDIERRKVEVFDLWLQSTPGASWRHIVTALREMGDLTTAERIELKYVKGAGAGSHQEELSKADDFALENRRAIDGKFAVFLTKVCDKMLKNGVNIEKFWLFVVALFRPGECIPPLPTNLTKIFEAITHHGLWDSLHYSPLVQIVRKFGANDPEMEDWIQNYQKHVKAYTIVASVKDYIQSNLDIDKSQVDSAKYDPRYNCSVEWKTEFVVLSLEHLTNVWEMFSVRYLEPKSPPTALLDRVRKGCLSVTWLVPSYLIPQLIKRAKVDTTFFQKHRILKVTVGGEIVYKEEVDEGSTEEPQFANQKGTPITKVMVGYEGRAEMGQPPEKPTFTQKETFGGYDCEFVEALPRAFQMECPICHLILREPYLVGCCGTHYCHTCIQRLQADNSSCPTCREDNFEVFQNKGLNRSLKQLQVYCIHRKDGCQWRGELGELDQHLNVREECPLTVFEEEEEKEDAKQGSLTAESELLKQEVAELRRQRDEDRAKLRRYTGVFPVELVMTNFEEMKRSNEVWYSPPFCSHPQGYKMCLKVYANGNGDDKGTHVSVFAYLMRGEFDDHLKWPFQGHVVIQLCNQLQDKFHRGHTIDFSETTDAEAISRVTTGDRAGSGWGYHTLIPHNDLNLNPTNNCLYLKNNCLHFQIIAVESLSEPGVLPTELTMTNFEQYKIDSDNWYSPPFYTHPLGYKMCLRVHANGDEDGEGTHVSVYANLMRGEFDDHLKWPFRSHVTIAMLNQLEDSNHTTETFLFTETTDNRVIGRVMERERAPCGWGYPTFIAHTELHYNPTKNCHYLKYDCLHFRIVKVELK